MARIRSIHPTLFTDEDYMSLPPYAMAAWPGLWCEADDQGVFEWKPLTLKARLLPCADVDMGGILSSYIERDMVRRFEVDGKVYGAIRNFRKFQRPEKPKAWHPLPEQLRTYVGLSPNDPPPVGERSPTAPRKSPQMEDGGGKMKGKEDARASAPSDAKAIWFEGQALRVNRRDWEHWERLFPGYADLWAEAGIVDLKLAAKGYVPGSKSFVTATGWLRVGHERLKARSTPPPLKLVETAA